MAIHVVQNEHGDPYFIALILCSKHNNQLDQVLENVKYNVFLLRYFDGITLMKTVMTSFGTSKIIIVIVIILGVKNHCCIINFMLFESSMKAKIKCTPHSKLHVH